jgi:nuclear pore complex protein Nup62
LQLAALYGHVLAAEREQNDIDQSLDHIEQQERELSATVEMYEKQMSDILGGQSGTLRTLDTGPADTERDKKQVFLSLTCRIHTDPFLPVTCLRPSFTIISTTFRPR